MTLTKLKRGGDVMEVSALIISLCSLAIQIKQYRNDHPQNQAGIANIP
ncbi:hypothetical protein [Corynebacterium macginleyi]|nr:hypothetical protein [Corynebacterium macginleyi]